MRRGVACAALVLLMSLGILATATVVAQATTPPSLDGSAKNGCGYVGSCSVTLTTANPSDVIVVGCNCWPVGGSFSVTDTAGLTFLPRAAPVAIGGGQFIQTWYAISSTPLTSDLISVKTPLTGETWYGVIAFGVSGANTANPFDPNPLLPRAQANINCAGSKPCNTGVSTTDANDFVFQFGGDTGYVPQTAGTGLTLIQYDSLGQNTYAQYQVAVNPLSAATLSFGTAEVSDFGVIADAIQPSSSTTTSSTSTTTTTISGSPPSLDGSAKNGCGYVGSCSVTLTTANPSDVIVVGCNCWPVGGSFSVTDTAGLTFLPRAAPVAIGGGQFIQTWYAISATPLTSDSISVRTSLTGETWYGVIAFGVSGANTANPFDPNPFLPRAQTNLNCPGSDPCNTGVSTTNPDDFVFQFGGDTGYGSQTAGTGLTLIQSNLAGQTAYAQYEKAYSPLSSATLSFGTSQGSDFGVIADAIQPSSSTTTSSTSTTTTSTSSTTSTNPPSLDGSAKNGCGYVGSCSVTLSTLNPSDVIVVGCNCWPVGGSFSVTDTAGLTFSARTSQVSIGGNQFIQTWYAIAPNPLIADVISVQTPLTGETWFGVIAFAVSGANLQAPFDPNPSIPRAQTNLNCPGSDPCNTGVSTTNPDDFVFQFGGDTGYTAQTAGAGLTLIQYTPTSQNAYAQFERTLNPLSSVTLAFGDSQGSAFGVIADAIQPRASSSNPTTTSVTPNPATVSISSISTFTATIKDTGSSPTIPTGVVTWTDGGAGGNFGVLPQCTLIPSGPTSAACSIAYTAPSATTSLMITASYSGDFDHSTSSGMSAVTVTSSGGGDWTSFTLDSSNSRYQASSTITSANVGQITQKWVISTPYSVTSTPVVLGGNVYFADWGGNVYSASVSTGQVNWEVNLGYVPITSTLLLANGMVYVGDGSGPPGGQAVLFALSQTDGHVVWSTQLDTDEYAVFASPIIFNGMVYIGVATNGSETDTSLVGKVFAVNATTGHVNWSFTASIGNTGGAGVWGSVAIDPSLDSIYFGTSNAYGPGTDSLYSYSIMSLNARTGSLNWYYQAYNSLSSGGDLDFGSTPNLFSVVVNGVTHAAIGLGGKDGVYYVLDRVTGSLLEKFQIGTGSGEGGIIGLPGFIYLGTNNPELFIGSYNTVVGGDYGVMKALTPATGSIDWAFNTPGTIVGSVVVVPGAVVFGDESGNVFALSTGSGSQLFHTSVPGSVLGGVSAAEGLLFVPMSFGTGGTGGVYAYG